MVRINKISIISILYALILGVCGIHVCAQTVDKSKEPVAVAISPVSGWQIGVGPGFVSPLTHQPFINSIRPTGDIYIGKRLTPSFGMGVESSFGFNTSRTMFGVKSKNLIDHSYLGVYATVDMLTLLKGASVDGFRRFSFEPAVGLGWLHAFSAGKKNYNFMAAKFGMNFNFALSGRLSLGIKPAVMWRLTPSKTSTNAFNVNRSVFSLQASIGYNFGSTLSYVQPYNQEEVEDLNGQINTLRSRLAMQTTEIQSWKSKVNDLEKKLESADNKPQVQVVKEVRDNLNSVRYVFFRAGSSVITADQQPNVEMIASYMKNHPESTLTVKGYASPEGTPEANRKLAESRAMAVKNVLISKYKIQASRITTAGLGAGKLFDEPTWNRVSVCTLSLTK